MNELDGRDFSYYQAFRGDRKALDDLKKQIIPFATTTQEIYTASDIRSVA